MVKKTAENIMWSGDYRELKDMIADFHKHNDSIMIGKMMQIQHEFLEEVGLDDSYMTSISINNRLVSTTGIFYQYDKHIEISGRLVALTGIFNKGGYGILADTIKHEVIHSILYQQGLNNEDGKDNFENMCKEYHVSSSSVSKYKINKTPVYMLRVVQVYGGISNSKMYFVEDRINPNENKYVDVKYIGTRVVSQTFSV